MKKPREQAKTQQLKTKRTSYKNKGLIEQQKKHLNEPSLEKHEDQTKLAENINPHTEMNNLTHSALA